MGLDESVARDVWLRLLRVVSRETRVEKPRTVSEWADEFRYLPSETSAEPGLWKTSRVPYIREPMDCLSDPDVEKIVLEFASQTSKTEGVIVNGIGYFIHQDPSAMLIVQPRDSDAKEFSRVRVAPTIRETPALKERVADEGNRASTNTLLEKVFDGGRMLIAGANAPANLAANPIRVVLADEIDRYPLSAGNEGDPVGLAVKRTATFPNRKIVLTSTPTDDTSRIDREYQASDKRRYYVPCIHCGVEQLMLWKNVKWSRDPDNNPIPETSRYFCSECGKPWDEQQRDEAVSNGRWKAQAKFTGTAGFHISSLYSPWVTFKELCEKWIEAKTSPLKLQVFVNTELAEVFKLRSSSVDPRSLMGRREVYPVDAKGNTLAPEGGVLVTAGVDVQDDRLEVQIHAWGRDDECWALSYDVLSGDPGQKEVWDRLWEKLREPVFFEDGRAEFIRATGLDTGGHHTQKAYEFAAPRHRYKTPDGKRAFVFALKGAGGSGEIWPRKPSWRKNIKVPLYLIKVDAAKAYLYSAFSYVPPDVEEADTEEEEERIEAAVRPGVVHFPLIADGEPYEYEKNYFDQLTAEHRVTEIDKDGREKYVWKLKREGAPNESLDTFVYSYAVLTGLKVLGVNLNVMADRNDRKKTPGGGSAAKKARKDAPSPSPASTHEKPSRTAAKDSPPGAPKKRRRRRIRSPFVMKR